MQNILLLGSCEGAGAEDIEQMIRIENVSKWYGDFQVLKNCSTSVKKGEVVVICGPSGSGKSTLIKTVNGLEDYQEGTIYVNNINIGDPHTNLPKLRAHVGMVFQHFELFPHLTIRDNLTLAQMKVLKRSRDQANKRGMELLDRVGLIKQADKFPPQLSGGQQQRVAIARALAMDPICMLFDEPTSGLDPIARDELLDVFRDIVEDGDKSILFSTHITSDLEKCADIILFIKDGRILLEEGKDELLEEHVIVKGGTEQLTNDLKSRLVAVKTHQFGFTALMKRSDLKATDNLTQEKPTLDDIMVYYNKKGALTC